MGAHPYLLTALSREVGVATERLLTKAEQVRTTGRPRPGYLERQRWVSTKS